MPRSAIGDAKTWPEYPLSDWAATERGTRLTRMRIAMGFGVGLTVERVFVRPRQTTRKHIHPYSLLSTPAGVERVEHAAVADRGRGDQ